MNQTTVQKKLVLSKETVQKLATPHAPGQGQGTISVRIACTR